MADNPYMFDIPKHHKSIIKVIGVGGGGSNAINHMFNQGIRDVEFIVCNTDAQALMSSPVPTKLQIGENLTQGLGAGANPEKGRNAALESKEEIRDLLSEDTKMVFITAGMGGGTGTGAAPIIARVAREMDILTVGIVTVPFAFEGKKKMAYAENGIADLKDSCDTVIVILNDKLKEVFGNLSIRNAFAQADNVLTTAAKGIAEIITVPGYVNVDFEDVKTVMQNSGTAVMGTAQTEGENRARRAAEEALSSPLLNEKDILGAEKILLSIISGEQAELQMDELTEITDCINEMAGEEAEVIFGHGIDPELGESIRVTVIATGFEQREALLKERSRQRIIHLESEKTIRKSNGQMDLFQEKKSRESGAEQEPAPDSRTYVFEKPKMPEEIYNDADEADQEDEDDLFFRPERPAEQQQMAEYRENGGELSLKKMKLRQQAKERIDKLKSLKNPLTRDEDYRDKWEKPAYLRRDIHLQSTPHSSEKNVSRYNLNDDNQIVGNNRFLHDNVD
jgi:cell division protein FtsZ